MTTKLQREAVLSAVFWMMMGRFVMGLAPETLGGVDTMGGSLWVTAGEISTEPPWVSWLTCPWPPLGPDLLLLDDL